MIPRFALSLLLLATAARPLLAADESEPKSHMMDVLKAQAAEAAKKKPVATTPPASAKTKPEEKNPAMVASPTAPPSPTAAKEEAKRAVSATEQPPTVLPQVEVKKSRITVLDHNLAVQDKEIAREKKNATPTEVDKALNDPKVSKALSIFGGQSGDYRANISKERVRMMEDEKEVIEAIAHAKTKAEKEELQKELDQLRALRRDLEKSLR